MTETIKSALAGQINAALSMLEACVDKCPGVAWEAPVCNLAFCQAVFHTLFFTDHYLGPDAESVREQPFHRQHPQFFREYEELQDKKQELLYDRPTVKEYLEHCRKKVSTVVAAETAESLAAQCPFDRLRFSRTELYVYIARHIQHHAAQLSLRLRTTLGEGVPWVKSRDLLPPTKS